MLNRILLGIAIAATIFICRDIEAQIAMSTAGGDAISPAGSFSYTAGQTVFTYTHTDEFELGQGIQQAYEVYLLAESELNSLVDISVFPNPTRNELYITSKNYSGAARVSIFNASGMLMHQSLLASNTWKVNIKNYVPGVYFLHLKLNNDSIKIYKIIKS